MARGNKWYVVWAGHETGVYDNWEDCKIAVEGFPGAKYKSYSSREEAIEAYRGDPAEQLALFKAMAERTPNVVNYNDIPEIEKNAIAVDAACSGNPGKVEYQGVDVRTGARLFHVGPLEGGSNNQGEFLALVHALAWLDQRGLHDVTIYSDSRTAMAWLRNRQSRSQIAATPRNAKIRELMERANRWVQTHSPRNPVRKWETDRWGEIPADFGRK